MKMPNKVEILCCFPSEADFGGDYTSVEVAFDGKTVAEYGDYYHDKGSDKAEGFVQGVAFALGAQLTPEKCRDVVRKDAD